MCIKDWRKQSNQNLLRTGRHNWTVLGSTVLCDCSVEHVDLVEEINRCKRNHNTLCWYKSYEDGELEGRSHSQHILFTATHSFRSSPSGKATAWRRFPLPNVAAACFIKSYWWVPSGMFFFGLKVLLAFPALQKKGSCSVTGRQEKEENRIALTIFLISHSCRPILLLKWLLTMKNETAKLQPKSSYNKRK